MAAPDIGKVLRSPGRLSISPGSVGVNGTWPFGGTGLGLVQDIVVKPVRSYDYVREEAFGNEVIDVVDLGESWVITALLRSFDQTAINTCFASIATTATSATKAVLYPNAAAGADNVNGTFRAGNLRSNNAVTLLFTPDDMNNNPVVFFYKALPLVEESASLKMALNEEAMIPVIFLAVRDTSQRSVFMGRMEDLVIS